MKPRLALIVFLSGASVMILELVGSRVVAPHLGSSTFVWTSLIGTVLGALSIGYYLGGHYADRGPSYKKLGWILLGAAVSVLFTALSKDILALIVQGNVTDLRLASIITAVFLFGPTSILLGMVSPYCIRLAMSDVNHSGATVGNLYAISTMGSILGTFLGGFWLISLLGTTLIVYGLALTLLLLSLIAGTNKLAVPVVVIFVPLAYLAYDPPQSLGKNTIDLDTEYQRLWITTDSDKDRPVRLLSTGPDDYQSGMYIDTSEPTNGYYSKFEAVVDNFPNKDNILIIGGAGMILPRTVAERYPKSSIHVVELDPGMTDVARKFFGFSDLPNLSVNHADGRRYLNTSKENFDIIILDAFGNNISIPFHLITEEALKEVARLLKPGGLVLQNVVASLEGDGSEVTRLIARTYEQVFSHLSVYQIDSKIPTNDIQNLAFIASQSTLTEQNSFSPEWKLDKTRAQAHLTDEYSPLEYHMIDVYNARRR